MICVTHPHVDICVIWWMWAHAEHLTDGYTSCRAQGGVKGVKCGVMRRQGLASEKESCWGWRFSSSSTITTAESWPATTHKSEGRQKKCEQEMRKRTVFKTESRSKRKRGKEKMFLFYLSDFLNPQGKRQGLTDSSNCVSRSAPTERRAPAPGFSGTVSFSQSPAFPTAVVRLKLLRHGWPSTLQCLSIRQQRGLLNLRKKHRVIIIQLILNRN